MVINRINLKSEDNAIDQCNFYYLLNIYLYYLQIIGNLKNKWNHKDIIIDNLGHIKDESFRKSILCGYSLFLEWKINNRNGLKFHMNKNN